VAELAVEGGKLVSTERVCTQIAAQKCLKTCSKATTTVDPRTINQFLLKKTQKRDWTLAADGTLSGSYSVAQLGYDDEDLDVAPPDSSSDDRVWNVDTSDEVREGFLTRVNVTASPLPEVKCTAYGTQKFATALKGKFDGSEASAVSLELDLTGSDAKTLGFKETVCDSQAAGAESPVDKQSAQIVRYEELEGDAFWACPEVSVFNAKLPGAEPELGQ
ncbi:MAG TPA: hypothetical protein VFX59_07215, partial [Polyangiales bacterium]|nr:hypothetical protein [Polyangiales bacterium]